MRFVFENGPVSAVNHTTRTPVNIVKRSGCGRRVLVPFSCARAYLHAAGDRDGGIIVAASVRSFYYISVVTVASLSIAPFSSVTTQSEPRQHHTRTIRERVRPVHRRLSHIYSVVEDCCSSRFGSRVGLLFIDGAQKQSAHAAANIIIKNFKNTHTHTRVSGIERWTPSNKRPRPQQPVHRRRTVSA